MNLRLILFLVIAMICNIASGQTIKYRLGVNYGKFNREVGHEEVENQAIVEYYSNYGDITTDFVSNFEPGFEAEVMQLWTPNVETGIELDYSKFSGKSSVPRLRNYYFSQFNSAFINEHFVQTPAPIVYESSTLNLLLNFRYYLTYGGSISPFFKAFGGLSFVSAELNFENQSVWNEGEHGILYALGTENSDQPREVAFCYGAGLGFDFPLSEKVSLYIDGTATLVNSDKVDGIPNYDYVSIDGQASLNPVNGTAFVAQVSLGFVFTTEKNLSLNKNWGRKKKVGSVKRTGRTTESRPFFRQKR